MSNDKASLESLIPMVGELQDILSTLPKECKIDIPQIVVLGDQSVGKSSTLEAIVGKDFLPRGGKGMVTRCPILLHLIQVPENDPRREHLKEGSRSEDWAIFREEDGTDSEVFTDFNKVREEISKRTDKICAAGVSEKVINLKIFSSKVIELTLVDLPGLITRAVEGQSKEVPKDIEKLVMKYVKKDNCIILHVTQATQDINTFQSIKIVDEVDKDYERTMCVLTKIDSVKDINNAKRVLTGELLKFKHGIIGVVNRSQEDIEKNKPLEDCLKDEENFLRKNLGLRLAEINGVYYLRGKLNKLLTNHIDECLPKFREEFDKEISVQRELLKGYGWPITKENKHRVISESINDFCNTYESRLSGTASEIFKRSTGAEIKKLFERFRTDLNAIDPTKKIDNFEKSLLYSIQNARGFESDMFVPEGSFKHFSKQYLSFFNDPSHNCAKGVFDLLKSMGKEMQKKMERFPEFDAYISKAYNNYLKLSLEATKERIDYLIFIQNASSNELCTSIFEDLRSDDFIKSIAKPKQRDELKEFTEYEKKTANLTEYVLQKYFDHVRKILQDVIPKAIMTSLILHVKENFKNDFINISEKNNENHK
uniref:Dynamin-type G domain-containing protein n=1 Tax=Panagrolaimus sp. PS1159 TaxID=55785 RepID=A0AC35GKD0_9BILA